MLWPVIMYDVSWLNFDNVRDGQYVFIMYIICLIIFEEKTEVQYRINTLWAWTRFKKPTILFRIVTEISGHCNVMESNL